MMQEDDLNGADELGALIRNRSNYVIFPPDGGDTPAPGAVAFHETALSSSTTAANSLPVSGSTTIHEAPDNPGRTEEVTFISGLNPDGTLAFYSYQAWNSDNPPTYDGGFTLAAKWFANASANKAATPGGTVTYYFDPASNWSTTEQNAFSSGLALWSSVANISFQATTNAGAAQIVFTRGSDGSAYTTPHFTDSGSAGTTNGTQLLQITKATISIDTSVPGFGLPSDGNFNSYGGYPWMTLLHEEGHAMGLGHAGPYPLDDSDPNAAGVPQLQFSPYDSRLWSIMSYIDPPDTSATYYNQYDPAGTNWGTVHTDATHVTSNQPYTLMPLDILAIQSLYGAPTSTPLSGGQTFGNNTANIPDPLRQFFLFPITRVPVATLWDAGVNNTLDVDYYSQNAVINLNPGTFSSLGGGVNNIAIAFNTRIDNLISGDGNDVILGNNNGDSLRGQGGNDVITGGSGDDTLTGGPGNDTLDGGAGTDTAVFQGNYSDYVITATANGYTVASNATGQFSEGTDAVTNIEFFKFKDGTVAAGAPFHSAPVLAGTGNTASYTEQAIGTAIAPNLTVTDASSTTLTGATVTITSPFTPGDLLNFTNQNGITGSYTGVETLTLSGSASLATYQAALRSITFTSSSDNPDFYGSWLTGPH